MKRVLLAWILGACLLSVSAKPNKKTNGAYTQNNVFYGVWKYEQVFHNDPMYNGIAKKEYILKLNDDGTYMQTIHIVPVDKNFYAGPLVYQLEGKWFLQENFLYITENGDTYPVQLSALKEKFIYFGGEINTAENSGQ